MKEFLFISNITNSVKVAIYSDTNENAWEMLKSKIESLLKEDVVLPRVTRDNWYILNRYYKY